MGHLEVDVNTLIRIVVSQSSVTLGAGGDDFLDSLFFDGGNIKPGKL